MTQAAALPTRAVASPPRLFGAAIVLGGFIIFAGNYNVAKGENGGLEPAIVSAAILVVLAAALYFAALPRIHDAGRAASVVSVVTIVSLLVFWLGITPLLAATAVVFGSRAEGAGKAVQVLGALAVVAAALSVVVGVLNLF